MSRTKTSPRKTSPATPALRASAVRAALAALGDPARAKHSAGFFKTGPGEYAEGDVFLGIPVPAVRTVVRRFRGLPRPEIERLLRSRLHEERLTALLLLVDAYERASEGDKAPLCRFYVDNLRWVNNWDLVDSSAHQILGDHLRKRAAHDRKTLGRLAGSRDLWERRVAVVATFAFILGGDPGPTFDIVRQVMADEHDLIHKAAGWMLREVGKRVSEKALRAFLEEHATGLPRTALRYAIERFPPAERKAWLAR
ncbi:MAG: DNA alkylation repair protein [Polyangiaceae bacterium]|jgi:3-methyladenine DNA glycosylase AlkD